MKTKWMITALLIFVASIMGHAEIRDVVKCKGLNMEFNSIPTESSDITTK